MAQQMETEKPRKVNSPDTFRGFISKFKVNPISKSKIIIAKDLSYQYQQSEDSYALLLPLAVKDLYMYVQSYIDSKTELTEHCIKITKINEIFLSGNASIYKFDASKKRDEARLNKGVRYVSFLCDFFDPDKNKALYKSANNSRLIAERKIKYDSDKSEYQDKCGFVELQHHRIQIENKTHNYVQILACKSYKGEKMAAKVSSILFDEFKYVHEYLKFVIRFYKLNDLNMVDGILKKHVETARKDVVVAIEKFEKTKSDKESTKKKENIVVDDDGLMGPSSSSKKRKNNSAKQSTSSKKETYAVNRLAYEDGVNNEESDVDAEDIEDDDDKLMGASSSKKKKNSSKKRSSPSKREKSKVIPSIDQQNHEGGSDMADEEIIKENEEEVANVVKIGKMKKEMDSIEEEIANAVEMTKMKYKFLNKNSHHLDSSNEMQEDADDDYIDVEDDEDYSQVM